MEFTGTIRALQALRGESDFSLLTRWVGEVFNLPLADTAGLMQGLVDLKASPHLPPSGLRHATVPSRILKLPEVCELAVELGMNLSNIDPWRFGSVRACALALNAPQSVHALLSQSGVPDVSLSETSRSMRAIVEEGHAESLAYLLATHEDWVKMSVFPCEGSVVLRKAFESWVTAFREDIKDSSRLKAMSAVAMGLSKLGVNWKDAKRNYIEVRCHSLGDDGEWYSSWMVAFDEQCAVARAARLSDRLPLGADDPAVSRPGRPRF